MTEISPTTRLRVIERPGEEIDRRRYAVQKQAWVLADGFEHWSILSFFEHEEDAKFFMANYGEPKVIAERTL